MSDSENQWHRVGGHRLQFYATDAEVAQWLRTLLPPEFAPYAIVGQEWWDGEWVPFEYPLERADECFARHRNSNLWIRSKVLTPELPADEKGLSSSGLILVQLGSEWKGKLEDASIAVVSRVRRDDGRERTNDEYRRLFERLRRAMRKRLVVRTAHTFPDGRQSESPWRMTARAADAHVRGEVTFAAEPIGLRP